MSTLQTLLLIYVIIVLICFFEAYFYAKLDPESKRYLEEREEKRKLKDK